MRKELIVNETIYDQFKSHFVWFYNYFSSVTYWNYFQQNKSQKLLLESSNENKHALASRYSDAGTLIRE